MFGNKTTRLVRLHYFVDVLPRIKNFNSDPYYRQLQRKDIERKIFRKTKKKKVFSLRCESSGGSERCMSVSEKEDSLSY